MTVLQDLLEKRDKAFADLEEFSKPFVGAEARAASDDESTKLGELRGAIDALDARIVEVNEQEKREAKINEARARVASAAPAVVRSEPRTYGPESPHSFYADLCRAALPGDVENFQAASARLAQHGKEMVRDAVNDPEVRARVIKAAREHYRKDEVRSRHFVDDVQTRSLEVRAMDTTSASGGSFVTPQYLVSDYAPYRQFGRVFINDTNLQPLPEYGMTVYLPAVQSAAGVGSQSQNAGVLETDPTAGYLSNNLTTEAGQVTISQQLLDRAGPGVQFDKIVFDQLQRAYNAAIDAAVITAAIANAGVITNTTSLNTGALVAQGLLSDIAKAQQQMETTAGTILSPDHFYATPTQWAFITSATDTSGRPLVVPSYAGPFNALAAALAGKDVVQPEGATGYEVLSLPVSKDGSIPASGSNTRMLVAHMPEVWVWEGELVPRTIPQTFAQNLSVLLQVYAYYTVIVRYSAAVQVITGSAWPSSPTFVDA